MSRTILSGSQTEADLTRCGVTRGCNELAPRAERRLAGDVALCVAPVLGVRLVPVVTAFGVRQQRSRRVGLVRNPVRDVRPCLLDGAIGGALVQLFGHRSLDATKRIWNVNHPSLLGKR